MAQSLETSDYRKILRRVGNVLILVGLLDICWMVYCIWHRIAYQSSFNIVAVVAGIFLRRGSLRAVKVIRVLAAFLLTAFIGMVVMAPIIFPMNLLATEAALNPWAWGASIGVGALALGLVAWVLREINRGPVVTALGPQRPLARLAAAVGLVMSVVLGITGHAAAHSDAARRATAEAAQRLGPGYQYFVGSIRHETDNKGKHVSGKVTAWNSHSVVEVPFAWDEAP